MSVSSGEAQRERVRRPSRGQVRQRLLDAAAEVLVTHGYGAASVDTITAAAGLSRGALYSNFADKEDLYLTLLDELERAQVAVLAELHEDDLSIDEFLARVAARLPTSGNTRSHLVLQTELWLLGTRNDAVRARLASIQNRTIEAIASILPDDLPLPPREVAAVVTALGDGLSMQRATDPSLRDGLLVEVLRLLAAMVGIDSAQSS
jgi:AcrR family transcriptional regulator